MPREPESTPTKAEVDQAIMKVALSELASKPVGSTVMISECIGFKKMPFWWCVRAFGFWKSVLQEVKDYKARRDTR